MRRWWERGDGSFGLSWRGAAVVAFLFSCGFCFWKYASGDLDGLGLLVLPFVMAPGVTVVIMMRQWAVRPSKRKAARSRAD